MKDRRRVGVERGKDICIKGREIKSGNHSVTS